MKKIKVTSKAADSVSIDRLIDLQANLKFITDENLEKLKRSILKHGVTAPIFVWQDRAKRLHLIDGHQRVKALVSLRDQDGYQVPAVPIAYIQAKNKAHAKEKLLYITSQYGEFSEEGVDEFLQDLEINFDDIRLTSDEFFSAEAFSLQDEENEERNIYTEKINVPIYQPQGVKPSLSELRDTRRRDEIIEKIEAAQLPEDVAGFLREAASRHIVFNYELIAEYYAHASADVKELFEEATLVIIDYDRAYQQGLIKLTESVGEILEQEVEDE